MELVKRKIDVERSRTAAHSLSGALLQRSVFRHRAEIICTILLAVAGALLCCPPLAVLALRRVGRLAAHPATIAKLHNLFPRGALIYCTVYRDARCKQPVLQNAAQRFSAVTAMPIPWHCITATLKAEIMGLM